MVTSGCEIILSDNNSDMKPDVEHYAEHDEPGRGLFYSTIFTPVETTRPSNPTEEASIPTATTEAPQHPAASAEPTPPTATMTEQRDAREV